MSPHREFSCSSFFSAFISNENELIELLSEFDLPVPSPFSTEEACNAITSSKPGKNDPLTTELYKLNDLATKKRGRDHQGRHRAVQNPWSSS